MKKNLTAAKIGLEALGLLRHTPPCVRRWLASVLGLVLWVAIPKRRHIIRTNLRLCFPDMSEKDRMGLIRRTYRNLARAAIDHSVLWWGSREEVRALIKMDGVERILENLKSPLIVVAPHFVGLDAAGIAFNTYVRGVSLYQPQSNGVWDEAAHKGRLRFCNPVLISKKDPSPFRGIIRAMREGLPFYYLPDLDHGTKNSIFVPFFGVPAATLTMASKLARLTRAKMMICVTEMTPDGYVTHVRDLEGLPSGDDEADTRRLTAELEKWILKYPDQYLWTHRRFKTRPEGEPPVY